MRSRRAEVLLAEAVAAPGVLGPLGLAVGAAGPCLQLPLADGYSLGLGNGLAWEPCRAGALRGFCAKKNDNGGINPRQYSCGSASGG